MRVTTYIFDWKRTLYDPDSKTLIVGAKEVLDYIKSTDVDMILIGKGAEDMYEEVERLEVAPYFLHVRFQEGQKQPSLYDGFIDKDSPKDTVFIGDRINSELAIGRNMGATTIWVKQGKFANEEPENSNIEATHTVSSLKELLVLLRKM